MLDDLFQDQTDAVLDDMVSRPPPVRPASKKTSVWGAITAAPRALATAAAETGAAVAEVVKGYGQVSAATDPMIGVMATRDTRDKLVQGQEQARRDMLERGVDVNSQASESLRAAARYWMPDPQTAGVAEQTVFGLVRFGAKAVAAAGAGPAAGPVLLGTDEGLAAAEGLRDQGVDLGTRTQAGVVAGATAGAAVALPVAAPGSLAGTVGLWAVGGPGGFIAQQQATRSILERAGYDDLAASYDPLDPVGLAVSSLIPAGFAAWAMRGSRAGRTAPQEPSAAGGAAVAEREPAKPVAQSAPATEPPRATLDEVDAARVELLTQHIESTRLTPADDMAGARSHQDAITRATDQLASGERVDVSDVAPAPSVSVTQTPEFRAWFGESKAIREDGAPQVLYHGTAESFDSFSMSRAGENGQNFGRVIFLSSDPKVASGYAVDLRKNPERLAAVQREEELSRAYAQSVAAEGKASENSQRLKRDYDQAVADRRALDARINTFQEPTEGANVVPVYASIRNPLEVDAGGRPFFKVHEDAIKRAQAGGHDGVIIRNVTDSATTETRAAADVFVAFKPEQVKSAIGNSGRFDPASASLTDSPFDAWAQRLMAAADALSTETMRKGAEIARRFDDSLRQAGATGEKANSMRAGEAARLRATADQMEAGGMKEVAQRNRVAADALEAQAAAARLAEVQQQFPDLTVQMDGMDAPVPLADFLAQVEREAMEGTDDALGGNDAPLMQVAAECALMNGA